MGILAANAYRLHNMIQLGKSEWPDIVRTALEYIQPEDISIWPCYGIPNVRLWSSMSGKLVLLGDAAHAIPPM